MDSPLLCGLWLQKIKTFSFLTNNMFPISVKTAIRKILTWGEFSGGLPFQFQKAEVSSRIIKEKKGFASLKWKFTAFCLCTYSWLITVRIIVFALNDHNGEHRLQILRSTLPAAVLLVYSLFHYTYFFRRSHVCRYLNIYYFYMQRFKGPFSFLNSLTKNLYNYMWCRSYRYRKCCLFSTRRKICD